MMYYDFYHLKQDPFAETPDPEFLFLSPSHRTALHRLLQGIEESCGLLTIVGAAGLGKTTILRALQERLQQLDVHTVAIMYPKLAYEEFLELLCRECGLDCPSTEPVAMLRQLQHTLQDGHGWRLVLFVDEAHHLPRSTLAGLVPLLTPQTTTGTPLLQVVLAGLPTLLPQLQQPALRSLWPRRTVQVTLAPLTAKESRMYMCQRLTRVLVPEETLFTPGALQLVVRAAQGNPRVINTLCTNMLITGALCQQQPISVALAREVLADCALPPPQRIRYWKGAAVLLLGAGLWYGWQTHWAGPERLSTNQLPVAETTLPVPSPPVAPVPPVSLTAEQLPARIQPTPATPAITVAPQMPQPPPTPVAIEHSYAVTSAPMRGEQPVTLPGAHTNAGRLTTQPRVVAQNRAPLSAASRLSKPSPDPSIARPNLRALDHQLGQENDLTRATEPAAPASSRPETVVSTTPVPVVSPPSEQTASLPDTGVLQTPPVAAPPTESLQNLPDSSQLPSGTHIPKASAPLIVQTIYFYSLPDLATVFVNGKTVGNTPVSARLSQGIYTVVVEKHGYQSIKYQLKIERSGEKQLYHDLHMDSTGG
jgi:general secretion pathway protein A